MIKQLYCDVKPYRSAARDDASTNRFKEIAVLSSVEGKVVVVTGGTRGIGRGISELFAGKGAKVAVLARQAEAAQACATALRDRGGKAEGFAADVGDRASLDAAIAQVVERFGRLDILCANAGIFPSAPLAEMTAGQWDEVLGINARGTFFSVQACLPWLKRSEAGRIVLTSSITGPVTGYSGWSHYAASKAAQLGFMRSAALELARDRITINAVLPGNVLTEGLQQMGEDYLREMTRSVPLGRLGSIEDIAYAVLFLASREAAFITGQTLVVDGGQILPESLDAF
ncbi:3-oxoacyl-ACP reductase FabG [Burkholderia seminalis]|uniref:3-oxoacyl-ACP reductase FabG n=1 Tax=Burkholderia seminalis TaxID=488731 RepID=UPI0021AB84A3|nr:3-oxoacyl-ACP reductase FabG [Burkholderia seminalis]